MHFNLFTTAGDWPEFKYGIEFNKLAFGKEHPGYLLTNPHVLIRRLVNGDKLPEGIRFNVPLDLTILNEADGMVDNSYMKIPHMPLQAFINLYGSDVTINELPIDPSGFFNPMDWFTTLFEFSQHYKIHNVRVLLNRETNRITYRFSDSQHRLWELHYPHQTTKKVDAKANVALVNLQTGWGTWVELEN